MYNKNITLLEHLNKLKDRIYLIQQKTLEGVLEFVGNGVFISFNFRSLPKSWNVAGEGNKLSVTVVDCKSTTVYVRELNGSPLISTRLLTREDIELLSNLYDNFRAKYSDGVKYFEPNIYYLTKEESGEVNEPASFIRKAIEGINFLKANKQ